jgi:hypothetical protein
MREDVRKILTAQSAKPTAREVVSAFLERMPLGERGEPLLREFYWVLSDKPDPEGHMMILPGYCYNIMDKLHRTLCKSLPSFKETVIYADQAQLAQVKSHEEAKQFLKLDWYRFGKLLSLPMRVLRFLDLEMDDLLEREGLSNLKPEEEKLVEQILGSTWLKEKGVELESCELAKTLPPMLFTKQIQQVCERQEAWSQVAYQWGPEAMSELNRGMADGLVEFMDEGGELVGKTGRTNNYVFFLIAWPEIKEMLERKPLPYRTEVFDWLAPFREVNLVCIPTIENFYDFCEDIGLKFAGRTPKKPK